MKILYVIFALMLLVCTAVVNADAGKILPTQATGRAENKQPGKVREGRRYGGGRGGHDHQYHIYNGK